MYEVQMHVCVHVEAFSKEQAESSVEVFIANLLGNNSVYGNPAASVIKTVEIEELNSCPDSLTYDRDGTDKKTK